MDAAADVAAPPALGGVSSYLEYLPAPYQRDPFTGFVHRAEQAECGGNGASGEHPVGPAVAILELRSDEPDHVRVVVDGQDDGERLTDHSS